MYLAAAEPQCTVPNHMLHNLCLQEYAALKKQLLDNTRKSGGAIGLYLLLTVNGQAALLAMTGAAASYGYLLWLCRDVDNVRPTDEVPIWEANKVGGFDLHITAQHSLKLLSCSR
jgi:hypothetical protein